MMNKDIELIGYFEEFNINSKDSFTGKFFDKESGLIFKTYTAVREIIDNIYTTEQNIPIHEYHIWNKPTYILKGYLSDNMIFNIEKALIKEH